MLEVSWQGQGCLQQCWGRGQGTRGGEEECRAEGFPAWQDEGCGLAGPVSPAQALCHEGSGVCQPALLEGCSACVNPALPTLCAARAAKPQFVQHQAVCVSEHQLMLSSHSKGQDRIIPLAALGWVSSAAPGSQLHCFCISETNPKVKM